VQVAGDGDQTAPEERPVLKRPDSDMKPESLQDHRAARQSAVDGDGAAAQPLAPGEDRVVSFETSEAVTRARKVAALHEIVAEGSYRSDSLLTAASMMDHERR